MLYLSSTLVSPYLKHVGSGEIYPSRDRYYGAQWSFTFTAVDRILTCTWLNS